MAPINGNVLTTDGTNGPSPWLGGNLAESVPAGSPALVMRTASDGVRPAWYGGDASGSLFANGTAGDLSMGGIGATIAQMAASLQTTMAKLSASLMGSTSGTTSAQAGTSAAPPFMPGDGRANFSDVTLSSTGDPHLALTGTERNAGAAPASVDNHFDSMTSHADLFSTRSFGDGFNVSTAVTQPSANGVTMNQSATASMNGGRDSVTMNNNGYVSILDNGTQVSLGRGQSLTLSGGETVTENADGAVTIAEQNQFGQSLSTTFTKNGGGVDVTASGHDVTLAGDLVTEGPAPAAKSRTGVLN